MAEDAGLRSRYAEALAAAIRQAPIVVLGDAVGQPPATTEMDLADAVLAVRDEELERLRGYAHRVEQMVIEKDREASDWQGHLHRAEAEAERLRAKAEAARWMLDAAREELGRERVEHGAVVAVLARVRALAEEWAAAGEDPVEPSDTVIAECGQELMARLGPEQECWFQRLCVAVEAVLIDHADVLDGDRVDANLADLAHLYGELTGFDAKEEIAKDAP